MSEHGDMPHEVLHYPEIETADDLKKLYREGGKIFSQGRELIASRGFKELSQEMVGGILSLDLGYLTRILGGAKGFQGRDIIEVAGGRPDQGSFNSDQTLTLAGLGANVRAIDPLLTDPEIFKKLGLTNIDAIGSRVQDYARNFHGDKTDFLISAAFLGGPDYLRLRGFNPDYPTRTVIDMAKLAKVQIHAVMAEEVGLKDFNVEKLKEAGITVKYLLDVSRALELANTQQESRSSAFRGYNSVDDLLVFESK